MKLHRLIVAGWSAVVILAATRGLPASVIGPYTVDSNTLHLWHFNDASAPVVDAPVGTPINLTSVSGTASLGNSSYSASFGAALHVADDANNNSGAFAKPLATSPADDVPSTTFWNQSTGAFTYEAIVKLDVNPATALVGDDDGLADRSIVQIISGDGESIFFDRAFQFDLHKMANGDFRLEFENIPGGESTHSNPLTVLQNVWYHVAVAYNGNANTPNNLTFYWTDMTDGVATSAAAVGAAQMLTDVTASSLDFAVGNEARSIFGASGEWPGYIDEVRISNIARSPAGFLFAVPEPSPLAAACIALATLPCRRDRRPQSILLDARRVRSSQRKQGFCASNRQGAKDAK